LNFNDEFMKNALRRIEELQSEVKDQAKQIEGASSYVQKQVELFKKMQTLQKEIKFVQMQEQEIANDFFNKHTNAS